MEDMKSLDVICIDAKPRPGEDFPMDNDTFQLEKDKTYIAVFEGEGNCPNGKVIMAYGLLEDPFTKVRGWNIDRFDIIPKFDVSRILKQVEPLNKLAEEYSCTR